jgi:GNAT superfamily N-acetyltransferase
VSNARPLLIRPATDDDLGAIATIAAATGQDEDWDEIFPAYIRHLITHGTFLVVERERVVSGYGGTVQVGSASMLTDLFVHPAAHGSGIGRAILSELWGQQAQRMTFSSLHSHALPLYTSFGVDAWWPLLYLDANVRAVRTPPGWSVEAAGPDLVAQLELGWTGVDRAADHRMWVARPNGSAVVASARGEPLATGSVGGKACEYGISHLAVSPDAGDADAINAVMSVLAWLSPADGQARVCLPAPHPAVRPLLASRWRIAEFDLHMASEFGLIDARRAVPSPALA